MMIWLFGNVDFFPASLVWLLIVILKMQYGPSGESLQALTPGKVSHLALDWKPSRRSCTRLRNESDRNGSLGWLILLFSSVQIFMSVAISFSVVPLAIFMLLVWNYSKGRLEFLSCNNPSSFHQMSLQPHRLLSYQRILQEKRSE